MSDAVAITGIVVSGVVGPAVGASVAQLQYRKARQSEREDELLHVLDDVVVYVNRGRRALELAAELAKQGVPPRDARAEAAWENYADQILPPMRAAFQRVFVRLGRVGPIPESIERVRAAFFTLRAPIDKYRAGDAWPGGLDLNYNQAHSNFIEQQDALYEVVYVRVGLPSTAQRQIIDDKGKRN